MIHKASFTAAAAALFLFVFSAEGSGAQAQQGSSQEITDVAVTEETVPAETEAPEAASLHELVAQMAPAGKLSSEMECLAGAIYFESRGEPLAGQLAVGQVTINRAESGLFPSDYCGVVFQRSQFSFVRGGTMPRIDRGSAAWSKATAIARIAHEGLWESEARDALFFHANYVRPSWSRTKIARATIDTHIFYR